MEGNGREGAERVGHQLRVVELHPESLGKEADQLEDIAGVEESRSEEVGIGCDRRRLGRARQLAANEVLQGQHDVGAFAQGSVSPCHGGSTYRCGAASGGGIPVQEKRRWELLGDHHDRQPARQHAVRPVEDAGLGVDLEVLRQPRSRLDPAVEDLFEGLDVVLQDEHTDALLAGEESIPDALGQAIQRDDRVGIEEIDQAHVPLQEDRAPQDRLAPREFEGGNRALESGDVLMQLHDTNRLARERLKDLGDRAIRGEQDALEGAQR